MVSKERMLVKSHLKKIVKSYYITDYRSLTRVSVVIVGTWIQWAMEMKVTGCIPTLRSSKCGSPTLQRRRPNFKYTYARKRFHSAILMASQFTSSSLSFVTKLSGAI